MANQQTVNVLLVDVPEGWRYGFPKIVPLWVGPERMDAWVVERGYPRSMRDKHLVCRFWCRDVPQSELPCDYYEEMQHMPTFETTASIDVSLDSFTDEELQDELDSRGVSITRDISDFDDRELFAEVEARDRFVTNRDTDLTQAEIDKLLSMLEGTYKVGSPEYFLYEKLVEAKKYAKS